MLLLVFDAVAQRAFELFLRPVVGQHAIDPADASRIRLTPEHVQVRRSHDRLGLITCHCPVVSSRSLITVAIAGVVPALPFVVAARAARWSFMGPVVPTAVGPPRQPR